MNYLKTGDYRDMLNIYQYPNQRIVVTERAKVDDSEEREIIVKRIMFELFRELNGSELKTFMYFYSFPTRHREGVSPPKIIAFTGDCESTIKRSITSLIDKGYLVEYEDVERTYKTAIPDRVIEAATAQRDY